MRFLYFIPGLAAVKREGLLALGLHYAFPEGPVTQRLATSALDGLSGVVCCHGDTREEIGWFPESQTWRWGPEKRYAVGIVTADPPTPADLARARVIGDYSALLGDGRRWTLPTAVLHDGSSPLPQVRELLDDGTIRRRPSREYAALYLAADQVRAHVISREDMTEREEWDICVAALACNYRLGSIEVNLLGLLTDEAAAAILSILVDRMSWPDLQEAANG